MHKRDDTPLLSRLHQLLLQHPSGLSEYLLIQQLKQLQQPLFIEADLSDPLSLFRTHFILFHALYVLRDALRLAGSADVQINALCIQLQTLTASTQTPSQSLDINDPLRAYYLDVTHLANTDSAAVEQLLSYGLNRLTQPQTITDALAELGLEQPLAQLSAKTIKQHYRQLVSRHHPDRGGSTERLQRINQAMDRLQQYPLLHRQIG